MVIVDGCKSLKDQIEENRQFAENIYKTAAERAAKNIIAQIKDRHLTCGLVSYPNSVERDLRNLNLTFDELKLGLHIVKYFKESEGIDITVIESSVTIDFQQTLKWNV